MKKEKMSDRYSLKGRRKLHDHENDFFIPERCCPDRFPSPKLPSPTDCLPTHVLEKVLEKRTAANELLLDLALGDDRPLDETYQKVFDGLLGLRVELTNLEGETLEGKVTLSGFNFVVLREGERVIMYPYRQIETVKPSGKFSDTYDDPELRNIDPCFRRNLTFHFGEVVSTSPELIHLFFRIRLDVYLLLFEDKQVEVTVDGILFEGKLTNVNKDSIVLDVDGSIKHIPLEEVSLITSNA